MDSMLSRAGAIAGALFQRVKRTATTAPLVDISLVKIALGRDHPPGDQK